MKYRILKYLRWLQQFGIAGLRQLTAADKGDRRPVRLESRTYGTIHCRRVREDFDAINTVMIFDAYHIDGRRLQYRTVLDLGANIGIASVFFSKHLPNSRIIAVEPAEENCRLYEKNLAQPMASSKVKLIRGAIGATDGDGHIEARENVRFDSFKVVRGSSDQSSDGVPILGIGRLVSELEQPLLVKIDIEGADQEILEHLASWAHRASCLMIEFHNPTEEEHWKKVLSSEGWAAEKHFDTWHFTKNLPTAIRDEH